MLFLGESDHRRFPLLGSRFTVRRSQLPAANPISLIARIGPISELVTRIEPADMSRQRPAVKNCQLPTANSKLLTLNS
jgi:hypothetical protein